MLSLPFYWLGPLGNLLPMACPDTGVSSSIELIGGKHQALTGRRTLDVMGYRRVWSFSEAYLDPADVSVLETFFLDAHSLPLRLIDPLIVNRARLSLSQTSNFAGYTGAHAGVWAATLGSVTFPTGDYPSISFTSPGDARVMTYAPNRTALWTVNGAGILSPNGSIAASPIPAHQVDAARVGEQLTFSAYIKVTGTSTVALRLYGVTTALATGTSASSSASSSTSWTRIFVTYTVPAGSVGVVPAFISTGNGTIRIAGGMINEGATALPWVRGGGSALVTLDEISGVSPRHPLVSVNLALSES